MDITNTTVGEPQGFGCNECHEDIKFCDTCNIKFDVLGQKIMCNDYGHFCSDCAN